MIGCMLVLAFCLRVSLLFSKVCVSFVCGPSVCLSDPSRSVFYAVLCRCQFRG